MYIIGIDPSSQKGNNGFAIWDTNAKTFLCVRSMRLLSVKGEALDFIESYGVKDKDGNYTNVVAVVEDAELDSPVFGAWQQFDVLLSRKLMPKGKGARRYPYNLWRKEAQTFFRSLLSQAQSIGKLKIACRIVVEGLEEIGLEVIRVAPSWRDSMDSKKTKTRGGLAVRDVRYMRMPTKTNSADFKTLTGYSERTNEHGRDAATLVYNQSVIRLANWVVAHLAKTKSVPEKMRKKYIDELRAMSLLKPKK